MFEVGYELITVMDDGTHVYRITWGQGKSRMMVVRPEDIEEDEPP